MAQLEKTKMGNYTKYGYSHHQGFFKEKELFAIEPILVKFHNSWLKKNTEAYSKGLLNSHSITSSKFLNKQEKEILFDFISQSKIIDLIQFKQPKFLNTQIFFDPKKLEQKNYWHRDI